MLCDSCKNKNICKHYDYFKNIIIDINVQVNECKSYFSNNQSTPIYNSNTQSVYRQPLPSTYKEEDDYEEDEEKIYIDVNELDKSQPQSASIIDLFMKGDK